jgi:beta-galactosidase
MGGSNAVEDLIDQTDHFALGVCYYPEHWPRDRWETYARQMRELGLEYVRIAEFAWSRIEPQEGVWNWAWLDEAIEVLAAEGLKVVLCTPTAAPPAWLVQQHPDILPVDGAGRTRTHGSRRHYDAASTTFREHSRRITREIAGRYGSHPAVVGWQLDNELSDHDTALSYSPASLAGFRRWVRERYETLGDLNDAWGTVFWSQEYTDWEQIALPNLTVAEPNPSLVLDFHRFVSDTFAEFLAEQAQIIRDLSPGRWITHNFMRLTPEFDHYHAAACLDFVSWDCYPTGAVAFSDLTPDDKLRFARTGHPDLTGFNHDLYRGPKGGRPFWVMEHQAGQINWAPSNPLPAAGAVALWTAHAWAHGASVVSYFRWRAATIAQEMMHSGLLRHDETLDRGALEIAALDLQRLPVNTRRAPVVLLHDYESLWVYDEQPHTEGASYWGQMMLFYRVLRSLGIDIDIRHVESDLSGYPVIVAPAMQIVDAARASHLARYSNAATLVFGPRTGYRTPTGRVQENGQPGPLAPLLGCKLLNFDGLPPGLAVQVGEHRVETWAESYRLLDGTATHTYTSGPLTGQPAVVRNGNALTIGAWSLTLVSDVLRAVLHERQIEFMRLPDGVRLNRCGNRTMYSNFTEESVTLPDGTILAPVSCMIVDSDDSGSPQTHAPSR